MGTIRLIRWLSGAVGIPGIRRRLDPRLTRPEGLDVHL